MRHLD